MTNVSLLRKPAVCKRRQRSDSQMDLDIKDGVMTPGIAVGKFKMWPEYEVDALLRAEIAGFSKCELRGLVRQLLAQRIKGGPVIEAA